MNIRSPLSAIDKARKKDVFPELFAPNNKVTLPSVVSTCRSDRKFLILILWAIFALVLPWMAGSLNSMTFMGFPLGYYFCVQGSLIAFVVMIWFQNWRQEAIDDEFGVSE